MGWFNFLKKTTPVAVAPASPASTLAPDTPVGPSPPTHLIVGTHYYKETGEYVGKFEKSLIRTTEHDGKKMAEYTLYFVDDENKFLGDKQKTFTVRFFVNKLTDEQLLGESNDNVMELYKETPDQFNKRMEKRNANYKESNTWTPEIEEARRQAKLAEEENARLNLERTRALKNAQHARAIRNLATGGSRKRQSSRKRKTQRNRNRKNRRQ